MTNTTSWPQWMQDADAMAVQGTTGCGAVLRDTLDLLAEAAKALGAVEWGPDCPYCHHNMHEGHSTLCKLDAALSRIRTGRGE